MRISEQKIEEIRNSSNIVDVISGYVQLKKRGKNFVGLCPFHQEKTPSFTVSEDKQIFHCFGCGAGGNSFKFLMDYKNISFVESVEEIAEQLGIKINYDQTPFNQQQDELEAFYEINILAARFFSDNLLKSSDGEDAREYLKQRNIKVQTQRLFGIGYAPYGWDNFLLLAKENQIDLIKTKHLGLIDTNERGEYYDKFRGRIIFPIFSPNGRVIAFGGRIMEKREDTAKYLNSPESKIYSKRKSLYGLFHSKDEIRKLDRAILVEGYMDLVSLFQAGIKNVVASSGTSLTEEQVQLLSRFTKNIIILFDADPAGQKAALRSIEILLKQDFEVKVITLPQGEDPDSFINTNGKEKFDELVLKSMNFIEYQTSQFSKQGLFEDSATATQAIRDIVSTIALVSDELKRSIILKTVAKKFNLREKLIETELNNILEQQKNRNNNSSQRQSLKNTSIKEQLPSISNTLESNPYEKELVRLLYGGNEEIVEYILEKTGYNSFTNPRFQKLVQIVSEGHSESHISPSYLLDKIEDDELKNFVFKLTMTDESISKKWDDFSFSGKIEKDTIDYARETVNNFLIYQIERQIKINNKIIENSKDEKLHIELLIQNKDLQEEKKTITNSSNKN